MHNLHPGTLKARWLECQDIGKPRHWKAYKQSLWGQDIQSA